ncbi:MAG: 5-(carboxyamino)imidazole ribonucleotide synthase [Rhizobiaceae bacterium]
MTAPLGPNATIGIIGGGQLARMLASSAARLGFRTIVLEPGAECPAAQVCNQHIVAGYDDPAALDELQNACDVVTYEFENVPLSAASHLQGQVPLYPPAKALEVSQDRLLEKQFLQQAGLQVADFHNVENGDDLATALQEFGGGILKTRRFGYDGKGQHVFKSADDENGAAIIDELGGGPFVLERKINFLSEFSVIAARAVGGSTCAFDPSTNLHEGGILRRSTVPAQLSDAAATKARAMATELLGALDYVGVIGVEFFLAGDSQGGEQLLINEFAPRVHNSGHWTREACATSQFEQHMRAVAGHQLGSVERYHDCEMLNLLGDEALNIEAHLAEPASQVTLYGKLEAREGRKMGHVTRLK